MDSALCLGLLVRNEVKFWFQIARPASIDDASCIHSIRRVSRTFRQSPEAAGGREQQVLRFTARVDEAGHGHQPVKSVHHCQSCARRDTELRKVTATHPLQADAVFGC